MSAQCSALRQNITYDVGLESAQAIMTSVHDFDGLRRSIGLGDQWNRFLRRTRIQEYMYSFAWRCNTPSKHQLQKLGQMAQKEWNA